MKPFYTPYFTCEYCGNEVASTVTGPGTGFFVPCDCEESRKEREYQHRLEMQRRLNIKRGL